MMPAPDGWGPRRRGSKWAHAAHALLSVSCALLSSQPAKAEWLSGPSRAISCADSASPDAPVTSYAYGPRAAASLGGDLAFYRRAQQNSGFRLGGSALLAVEDATRHALSPGETLRSAFELSLAWSWTDFAARALGPHRELEWTIALGRHSALPISDFTLGDRYHADDVPFGAGGGYLATDVALRAPFAERGSGFFRLGARAYTNLAPDLVGAHEASDFIADSLHEGAKYQTFLELGLRYAASPRLEPVLRLYFDLIAPHDDQAKVLALARLLVGAALPAHSWELTPFTALEAGRGEGIAVNRTELRWSGGVRLYAR
jgi:hypothetical protein